MLPLRAFLRLSALASLCLSAHFVCFAQATESSDLEVRATTGTRVPAENMRVPGEAVPRLVRYTGVLHDAAGAPRIGSFRMDFALYREQQGGDPLWSESQVVTADETGHYSVMLGASMMDGIGSDALASGEARWLAVNVAGETAQSRMLMVSVPYALKAEKADDAEKVGGHTASDFVLKTDVQTQVAAAVQAAAANAATQQNGAQPGDTKDGNFAVVKIRPGATSQGTTAGGGVSFSDTSAAEVVFVQQNGTGIALTASSAGQYSVRADNISSSGTAVLGFASATTGTTVGVQGTASSSGGVGVAGTATSGGGIAVRGSSTATSGSGVGVKAETFSPTGTAAVVNAVAPGAKLISGQQNGAEKMSVDSNGNIATAGNVTASGTVTAAHFVGDGSGLTGLAGAGGTFNGGTVANATTFNGAVTFNAGASGTFSGNGSGLTGVNAALVGGAPASTFAQFGGANAGDLLLSTGASSSRTTGITGLSSGQTAILQLGDSANTIQNSFGQNISFNAFNGFVFNAADGNATQTANLFDFQEFGASILTITDAQNVGIGTATPGAKLDVAGSAPANSLGLVHAVNTAAGITNASPTNFPPAAIVGEMTDTTPDSSTVGVVGKVQGPTAIGVIGINFFTGTSTTDHSTGVLGQSMGQRGVGGEFSATDLTGNTKGISAHVSSPNGVAGQFQNDSGSGWIIEGDNASGSVFNVDANGNAFFNGTVTAAGFSGPGISGGSGGASLSGNNNFTGVNTFSNFVGIGTTTPSTTLDVAGSGNFSGQLSVFDLVSAGRIALNGAPAGGFGDIRTNGNVISTGGTAQFPSLGIGLNPGSFTVDPSGNLATNGTALFHPFGDAREISFSTPGGSDGGLTMRASSGDLVNRVDVARLGGDLLFYTGNQPSPETMHLTSTRLVGINTSTPTQALDVNGNEHVSGSLVVDGTISASFAGNQSVNTLNVGGNFAINNASNVQQAIQVNGDFGPGSNRIVSFLNSNASGAPFLSIGQGNFGNDALELGWDNASQTGFMNVHGDSTPGFTVKQGGFFGINTSTPSQALDVNGTVRATSFVGDGSGLTNITTTSLGSNATSSDVGGTLVLRDAGGNFSAGTITALGQFTGSGAGLSNIPNSALNATSANVGGALVSRDAGGSFDGATITAHNGFTGDGSHITGLSPANISNVSTANIGGDLVIRDAGGNFSAGTITATQFNGSGAGLSNIPNSALNATSANVGGALVSRDAGGNFDGATITAHNGFVGDGSQITGLSSTNIANVSSSNIGGDLVIRDAGGNFSAGTITATQFNGSGAGLTNVPNTALNATASNVGGALVLRDAGGNFTAGTISATQFNGSGAGLTNIGPTAINAVPSNLPNTVVSRDGSGSFAAQNISAAALAAASATFSGQVTQSVSTTGDALLISQGGSSNALKVVSSGSDTAILQTTNNNNLFRANNTAGTAFLIDGQGRLATYNGVATAAAGNQGPGLAIELYQNSFSRSGGVLNFGPFTFVTPASAGLFRVTIYMVTTAADSSAITVTGALSWNDGVINQTQTMNSISLQTLGSFASQEFVIRSNSGQPINFQTSIAGGTGSTGAYTFYVSVERM